MTLIADHASIRDLIEELSREYLVDNLEAVGDVLEKLRNQAQLTADYIQQVTKSFVNYVQNNAHKNGHHNGALKLEEDFDDSLIEEDSGRCSFTSKFISK